MNRSPHRFAARARSRFHGHLVGAALVLVSPLARAEPEEALATSSLVGTSLGMPADASDARPRGREGRVTPPPTPAPREPRLPSPLPEIAAVFPGVLVHGSGVWLQRRSQTAQRLLLLEGAAVLTTLASGFALFQTGAARDVVGPAALGAVAGIGTFAASFLANVYAAWAPADGLGAPLRSLPLLESSLGYLYVYDPQFDYRHFATASVAARLDAWRVSVNTAVAPARDNQRFALLGGYRLLGPRGRGSDAASDGSYLEPRVGYSEHRFGRDGFSSRVIELALEGRLDLQRYLPDVRGAFFQGEAGWAKQVFHHDLPGADPATWTSLLLARVGFGLYLGNRGDRQTGGEVQLYYDHRHDGFVGGLKVNGLGSGPAGHFGIASSYQLSPDWGVRLRTEAGSAYLFGLDAVLRTW